MDDDHKFVRFRDCPPGLFRTPDGVWGLMTECSSYVSEADGVVKRDAYVIDSGEYFQGGASTNLERMDLLVEPVDSAWLNQAAKTPAELVDGLTMHGLLALLGLLQTELWRRWKADGDG